MTEFGGQDWSVGNEIRFLFFQEDAGLIDFH
jgi:hypothetical protein